MGDPVAETDAAFDEKLAQMNTTHEVIEALEQEVERLRVAAGIAADLVAMEPRARQCRTCSGVVSATGRLDHDEGCVWLRAKQLAAALTEEKP